jgi:hypothetical protein
MKRVTAWVIIALSSALGVPESIVLFRSLIDPSDRSLDRWAAPLAFWGLPLFAIAIGLSGGFAKKSISDPFADFRQLHSSVRRASMVPLTVGAIVFGVLGVACSTYGLSVGSGQREVVAEDGAYYSVTAGVKTPISKAVFDRKTAAVSWLYDGAGITFHSMTVLMSIAALGSLRGSSSGASET